MAAALPVAAVAMQAIGPLLQGIGGKGEARAAARADDENARLSLLSGERDVEQFTRDERMMAGDALSAMGSAGLAVGVGSSADILIQSVRERDRDIATRRKQAASEHANYRQAAKDKRAAGRNALIQGAFGAVSSVLQGANSERNRRLDRAQGAKERSAYRGRSD